jgi:hypothetical protein
MHMQAGSWSGIPGIGWAIARDLREEGNAAILLKKQLE